MEFPIFKIHCRNSNVFPSAKNREKVREMVENTGLFEFIGKSRIDGYDMFRMKDGMVRLGKIQKIKKISPTVMDKAQTLFEEIGDDIRYVTLFNGEYL